MIEQNNQKTKALLQLQTAIHHRQISLRNILLHDDAFEQDAEIMHFSAYAINFIKARDQLLSFNLSKREIASINKLYTLINKAQPNQQKLLDLILEGETKPKLVDFFKEGFTLQNKVVEQIKEMVKHQELEAKIIAMDVQTHYKDTKNTIISIYLVCFLLASLIAIIVVRKINCLDQKLVVANKNLEVLVTQDSLTGLSNRRHFNQEMELGWLHCSRCQSLLSVIMIDVDHFKLYNDTFGHIKGDEVLRKIGTTLKQVVHRQTDIVARYGGEEFIVVLPATSLKHTQKIADKILNAISSLKIKHVAPAGIVSVSIGMASAIPDNNSDYVRIVELADKALYHAKKRGRNQVYNGNDEKIT